jgi:hypothetical protein
MGLDTRTCLIKKGPPRITSGMPVTTSATEFKITMLVTGSGTYSARAASRAQQRRVSHLPEAVEAAAFPHGVCIVSQRPRG